MSLPQQYILPWNSLPCPDVNNRLICQLMIGNHSFTFFSFRCFVKQNVILGTCCYYFPTSLPSPLPVHFINSLQRRQKYLFTTECTCQNAFTKFCLVSVILPLSKLIYLMSIGRSPKKLIVPRYRWTSNCIWYSSVKFDEHETVFDIIQWTSTQI